MMKIAFFAGIGLVAVGVAAIVCYVRSGIARDARLDAAAIQAAHDARDTPTVVLTVVSDLPTLPPVRTMAEIAADGMPPVPPEPEHAKTLEEWLDEPARTWARDHAMRTAAAFAGQEHDQVCAWDDWLNGHLAKLGFADVYAVNAEMDAELTRCVDRMVAWTTETAAWPLIEEKVPA